jgi:5-methylcytosine-specific restriction endonuclease McrA
MPDDSETERRKAYNALYHAKKREQILSRKRDAYHARLEEKRALAAERMRRSRAKDPDKFRERNRKAAKRRKAAKAMAEGRSPGKVGNPKRQTPEDRAAYLAQWRQQNADKLRAQDATRKLRYTRERAASEGRELRSQIKYRTKEESIAARRAKCVVYANRHRALKLQAKGSYTVEDIQRLFELQRGKCVLCLRPLVRNKFEVDHHVALSRGGSNEIGNLRLLHKKCNASKGARDPAEHARRNGLLCW